MTDACEKRIGTLFVEASETIEAIVARQVHAPQATIEDAMIEFFKSGAEDELRRSKLIYEASDAKADGTSGARSAARAEAGCAPAPAAPATGHLVAPRGTRRQGRVHGRAIGRVDDRGRLLDPRCGDR